MSEWQKHIEKIFRKQEKTIKSFNKQMLGSIFFHPEESMSIKADVFSSQKAKDTKDKPTHLTDIELKQLVEYLKRSESS